MRWRRPRRRSARPPAGPVLPAFELITTVASSSPGKDGTTATSSTATQVQRYLDAPAGRHAVVLDFQPGRADFLDQVRRYEAYLLQPDVGVALDPEWKLKADQVPLKQIGRSRGRPDQRGVAVPVRPGGRQRAAGEDLYGAPVQDLPCSRTARRSSTAPGLATVLHVDGFGCPGGEVADVRHPRQPRRAVRQRASSCSTTRTSTCSPRPRRCGSSRGRAHQLPVDPDPRTPGDHAWSSDASAAAA